MLEGIDGTAHSSPHEDVDEFNEYPDGDSADDADADELAEVFGGGHQ